MDNISVKVLKLTTPVISESLATIFNASLVTGIFPDVRKTAKVSPIYKTGERVDRNNCKPISVLPVISKIFESKNCFYSSL